MLQRPEADVALIRSVARALSRAYGAPSPPERSDPLDGLIGTLLSQNTTSANARRAFAELKRRCPTWGDCLRARPSVVRDAIRSAGLAEVRAPRLLAILRRLQADRGELSLDFLARETVPAAQRYLESLPGVGPKTAACVLLFAFGRAVFPVDTHVARIARRLGWAPDRASPEAIQALLGPRVPPSLRYALHVNLIAHGRATCRARNPRCPGCPILRLCPTGRGRERS